MSRIQRIILQAVCTFNNCVKNYIHPVEHDVTGKAEWYGWHSLPIIVKPDISYAIHFLTGNLHKKWLMNEKCEYISACSLSVKNTTAYTQTHSQ